MATEMTAAWLKAHCKEQGHYTTPALNDKLFLHFKGFDRIQNLEPYTGLKALFLEGNGLEELEGLGGCLELRCLFAQQNMLHTISPGLPAALSTLNVSNNSISLLENLAHLPDLQTLQVGWLTC
jgi:dynein assembly factor 1